MASAAHPAHTPQTLDDAPVSGVCHALFAYDIGLTTDLAAVARSLGESTARQVVRQRRRAPKWFDYEPAPLRVTLRAEPLDVAGFRTEATVDCTLYDFGAASVAYRLPVEARSFADLPALSAGLYDNAALLADSRARIESLLELIRHCVAKPGVGALEEDYVVIALHEWGAGSPEAFLDKRRDLAARLLEAEDGPLSAQQVAESLGARLSFTPHDLAVIDWHGALLFDPGADDVLAVLEHVNVELLEMRMLDDRLDGVLERAHDLLARQSRASLWPRPSGAAALRELADLQADSSLLFEGVNNAIKLLGDQYLARLYRLAAQRLHLPAWDASVLRKIDSAESIYQKIAGFQSTRRMEVLEIVIVVLILVSILLPFVGLSGH
ncbi:MAG: hypothetical protein ACF8QF_01800 [Phycisphaerales bacterium]